MQTVFIVIAIITIAGMIFNIIKIAKLFGSSRDEHGKKFTPQMYKYIWLSGTFSIILAVAAVAYTLYNISK